MKIVFSSDWHGDVITQGVNRYEEVEDAAMWAVRHAIAVKADLFVFMGDLCDPHTARAHRSVALAHKAATTLSQAGVPSMWLVGNHDVVEDGSGDSTLMSLKWANGNVLSQPVCFPFSSPYTGGSINIIALPFTPSSHGYDPVKFIEGLTIGNAHPVLVLGHLNLKGITAGSETKDMPRGRELYWPIDTLKQCFPKAILVGGHYHERQVYAGVRIVGSQARLTYGEGNNNVGYLELEI